MTYVLYTYPNNGVTNSIQFPGQHAFTRNIRIEDALFYIEVNGKYANEFTPPLWLTRLDLRKAFDTTGHSLMIAALQDHGTDETYIALLQLQFAGDTKTVNDRKLVSVGRDIN